MRLLSVLVFSFLTGACVPRKAENPAANAPTYSGDAYYKDLAEVLGSSFADKAGLKLRASFHDILQDDVTYEVILPEKIESRDQGQIYQEAIFKELERLEAFLEKYHTPYRLHLKNGDLKLITATSSTRARIENLKMAWSEALSQLEEKSQTLQRSATD